MSNGHDERIPGMKSGLRLVRNGAVQNVAGDLAWTPSPGQLCLACWLLGGIVDCSVEI